MPRVSTFDFTDTPPAQGGAGSDHIPPGRYIARCKQMVDDKSKNGNRMVKASWEVASGEEAGKNLRDNFVLEGESRFGYQRFHACLLALGVRVEQKSIRLDMDKLTDRACEVVVVDEKIPATETYAERQGSKIVAYYALEPTNGKKPEAVPAATATVAKPKAAAPAPAPAAVAVAEPEPALDDASDADLLDVAEAADDLFS